MATWWCTYLLNWWSHTYIHDCIYQCKSRRKQLALLCSHSIWEKEGNWLYVYIKNFSWLTFIHVEWNRNFSLKYGKSKASVNSGAPNGSVPQNICSSGQFLLAGRFGKSNMSLEIKCCWWNFALWLYPNWPVMSVGKLAGWKLFHQSRREWRTDNFFPAISQNA